MPSCETCPIHKTEWEQLGELFLPLLTLIGGAMYNHKSQSRKQIDAALDHWCSSTRERHGDECGSNRFDICHKTIANATSATALRPKAAHPIPYFLVCVRNKILDENTYEALRQTRQPVSLAGGLRRAG